MGALCGLKGLTLKRVDTGLLWVLVFVRNETRLGGSCYSMYTSGYMNLQVGAQVGLRLGA